MSKITIDGVDYDTDSISNDAKNALGSLQFADSEIQRTQMRIAALQTARNAYAKALKQALDNPQPTVTKQ